MTTPIDLRNVRAGDNIKTKDAHGSSGQKLFTVEEVIYSRDKRVLGVRIQKTNWDGTRIVMDKVIPIDDVEKAWG